MRYTKDILRITKPSQRLLELMEKLKDNKRQQLERLRKMNPEDFEMRVSI